MYQNHYKCYQQTTCSHVYAEKSPKTNNTNIDNEVSDGN